MTCIKKSHKTVEEFKILKNKTKIYGDLHNQNEIQQVFTFAQKKLKRFISLSYQIKMNKYVHEFKKYFRNTKRSTFFTNTQKLKNLFKRSRKLKQYKICYVITKDIVFI